MLYDWTARMLRGWGADDPVWEHPPTLFTARRAGAFIEIALPVGVLASVLANVAQRQKDLKVSIAHFTIEVTYATRWRQGRNSPPGRPPPPWVLERRHRRPEQEHPQARGPLRVPRREGQYA